MRVVAPAPPVELALRRREHAEDGAVRITARPDHDGRAAGVRVVGRHHGRRPAVVRDRICGHPLVAERHQELEALLLVGGQGRDGVAERGVKAAWLARGTRLHSRHALAAAGRACARGGLPHAGRRDAPTAGASRHRQRAGPASRLSPRRAHALAPPGRWWARGSRCGIRRSLGPPAGIVAAGPTSGPARCCDGAHHHRVAGAMTRRTEPVP